jgi:hypothetical protein
MELLNVCVSNSYFQTNDGFYEQASGTPMGGVLSPILSNLFMDKFEEEVLNVAEVKPRLWLRYVDDVFCIWEEPMNKLLEFKKLLNYQYDSIKFTVEYETENKLPFLDVLLEKNLDFWVTSVYRKPMGSGLYLNYYKSIFYFN